MKIGELFNIFKQNDIPDDAVLMSDSGWECCATDMDGVYYNKAKNTVVFTQDISKYDSYYKSQDWIVCKKQGKIMSNEEAITRLKGLYGNGYMEQEQALDMAIHALKNEQTGGDLISKQKVLDMLNKIDYEDGLDYKKWVNYVESLPTYSAKEDTTESDGDLISRKAVLDNIKTRLWQTALNNDEYITSYANVCEDIADHRIDTWVNELPSAENVASWVALDDYPSEDWECDNCGYMIAGVEEPYRFCPNCGKKMWK